MSVSNIIDPTTGTIFANLIPQSSVSGGFQGLWNASTNTPQLSNPTPQASNGWFYIVQTAGTQFVPPITFNTGDYVVSPASGGIWQKVEGSSAVSSVFSRTGAIIAQNGDYNSSQITFVPTGGIQSTNVQEAIDELDDEKYNKTGGSISGNVSITGTLSSTGDLKVNTNKFTVNSSNGDISSTGLASLNNLTATGTTNLSATTLNGTVNANSQNISNVGSLTANSISAQSASLTGDLNMLNNDILNVDNLQVLTKITTNNLENTGSVTLKNISATGTCSLPSTTLNGTLDMNSQSITNSNNITSTGLTSLNNLTATGTTNLSATTLNGSVNANSQNISNVNNISISGTQTNTGNILLNVSNSATVPVVINSSGSGHRIFTINDTDASKTFYVNNNCDVWSDGHIQTDTHFTSQGSGTNLYDATITTDLKVNGNTTIGTDITDTFTSNTNLNMNSNYITNLQTPNNPNDAVTKQYVDALVTGLNPDASCYASTTTNLTGWNYLNGSNGVGATLTNTVFGQFTTDGGIQPPINSLILVKDETSQEYNGVYILNPIGNGSTYAVLTRATNYDKPQDFNNSGLIAVQFGTSNGGNIYLQTANVSNIGISPIVFTLFVQASNYLQKSLNLSDLNNASTARTNLGVAIGSNVQAYSPILDTVSNNTYIGSDTISKVGTITTGDWHGGVIAPQYGGTGVNNGVKTLTLANNLTQAGSGNLTLTTTNTSNLTIPTGNQTALVQSNIGSTVQAYSSNLDAFSLKTAPSGTVVGTTDGQTLTNKTIDYNNNTITNIPFSGLTGIVQPSQGGTGVNNASRTITLGGNLTTTNNNITLNAPSISSVNLPASGTLLSSTNNLSDLASASTSRTNLGLGSLAVLNQVNNKVFYCSPSGSSSASGLSQFDCVDFATGLTLMGSSGNMLICMVGTYPTGTYTISNLNGTISAPNGNENSSLVNFGGSTFNITGASSSVRIVGLTVDTINHNNLISLYLYNVKINVSLNLSSNGYFLCSLCDLQGTSGTAVTNVTGSGQKIFIQSYNSATTTINNVSANVSFQNNINSGAITLTNGVFSANNSVIYSLTNTSNAITSAFGTTCLLQNVNLLTPSATPARCSLAGNYGFRTCYYDNTNSTLTGTNTPSTTFNDALQSRNIVNTSNITTATETITGNLNSNTIAYNSNSVTSGSSLDFSGATNSIIVPKGTTGQQPTPIGGMIRYNTSTNAFEGASGASPAWLPIGGSGTGPTWTQQTDTYTIPSSYLTTPTYYAPQASAQMRLQCITDTYAIYQNSNTTTCYVYTISSGILTYASTFNTDFNTNRIVASGNMIVICSSDFNVNASIKAYTYSNGNVSLSATIASYLNQSNFILMWSPDIYNISGNTFMLVYGIRFQSSGSISIQAYYYNGASWSGMTNGSIGLTQSNEQTDCMRIIWNSTASLYQIMYWFAGSPTATLRTWTINPTSTPTIASTSPTQTITFTNGSPSGFSSYQYSMANYDGTTPSLPYIHITVGSSDSSSASALGGGVQSYRWNGSSWVSALTWQMSSYVSLSTGEQAGYLNNSVANCMYSTLSYATQAFGNNLLIASQLAVIYQFTMTKTASAPFLAITYNNQLLPYGTKQSTTKSMSWGIMPNGNLILTERPDGNFNLTTFPIGSGSTVNVAYYQTTDNIRESNRLAVKAGGGILEMGITTAGQLPQTGTYSNGTMYFDGDSLWILIQGTWRRVTVS